MSSASVDPSAFLPLILNAAKTARRIADLEHIFKETFKRYVSRGAPLDDHVKIRVLPDDESLQKASDEEALRVTNLYLQWVFELVREWATEQVEKAKPRLLPGEHPSSTGRAFTPAEIGVIRAALLMEALASSRRDAKQALGFFGLESRTIYILKLRMGDAGTLAHEMAHAYASDYWNKFIFIMTHRKMGDPSMLDEGMAIYIANIVYGRWFSRQPNKATGDTAGDTGVVGYPPSFLDRAKEFIGLVGKQSAFEAFFGGVIKEESRDTFRLGNARRRFKWPWH